MKPGNPVFKLLGLVSALLAAFIPPFDALSGFCLFGAGALTAWLVDDLVRWGKGR